MDQAAKLERVEKLIEQGRQFSDRSNSAFTTWHSDAKTFLNRAGASVSQEFANVHYHPPIVSRSTQESTYRSFFNQGVAKAVALLESARNEILEYPSESRANASTQTPVELVVSLCRHFPRAARLLLPAKRHGQRGGIAQDDEYDVQDVLRSYLHLHFDDVRAEEWTASYAGASARMDFLLPAERIVVEVKRTREGLGAKQAKEQLAIDIDHYRVHPQCGTLICFVFDPDHRIDNPAGFASDLEAARGTLNVRVVVAS